MASLADLVAPDAIIPTLRVANKRQALHDIAAVAAPLVGRSAQEIAQALMAREREGSTGLGNGVALPHARLDYLRRRTCLFVRLEKPIDFEAVDHEPVDVMFVLFTPAMQGAEHLRALSRISRAIRTPGFVQRLREAHDTADILAILDEQMGGGEPFSRSA